MATNATNLLSLSTRTEYAAYSHTSRHDCWAVTTIKAPFYEPQSRAPIDVVAVIDKSGSMDGVKIDLVRKTLVFVISQLKECDRFSLVTYDSTVTLNFGLLKMTKENRDRAKTEVEAIKSGSATNLCGGLLKGMEEIAYNSGEDKSEVQSVLLLTDGLANEGIKTKDGILAEMRRLQSPEPGKVAQKSFNGTVYTFGFGSDHDASMLTAISTQGGGVYYYIDSNEKIPESFADCLGGLLSVVGQNLSLKLEIQEPNQFTEVHALRSVNWITPNKCCEIAMGDIQSEEERDIVLTLVLPALAASEVDTVLQATLSYFDVISSTVQTISCGLVVNRNDSSPGAPDGSLDQQRNRIVTTEALKQAQALADKGDLDKAKQLLVETITRIQQSVSAQSDFSKALVVDLNKSLAAMSSREQYRSHGQKILWSKVQTHSVQRSNYVDDEEHLCYEGASKVSCRAASKKHI